MQASVPGLEYLVWVGGKPAADLGYGQLVSDGQGQLFDSWAVSPADPFLLAASSGTTSSRPKICVHTHAGLLSNARQTAEDGKSRADDVLLSASPFSHAFGFLSVHLSVIMQHPQVVFADWSAPACLRAMADYGVTVLFAVPAQVVDLLRAVENGVPEGLRLREIRTGGAAVPREVVAAVRCRFGAGTIVQWGMSEVGSGCYTTPDDDPELASRTVGRPVSGAEVRVLGPDGRPAPPGAVGELAYRSPYMFRGYFHDPELTRQQVTEDGWLLTGDVAEMNPDGTVAYRGRKTETINRGGLKFSALEVESLLTDLPHIQQMAVVPKPDDRLGERAVLLVALRPGYRLTLADIRAHLQEKGLAPYKWPEELVVVDALPTTPTGKIARGRISTWMAEGTDHGA